MKYKPGKSGNPQGRPLGAKHKFSEQFIAALSEDFSQHGKAVIEKVREEKPAEYLKVCARLMPRDVVFDSADGECLPWIGTVPMTHEQWEEKYGKSSAYPPLNPP